MRTNELSSQKTIQLISKMIFIFCAFYFFIMGISLIFLPNIILKGFSHGDINQTIVGMLRGAGGAILPYSLLYIMFVLDPHNRQWVLYVILVANIIAIILDFVSFIISEYKFSNAMIDLPFEVLSIIGIVLFFLTIKITKRSALEKIKTTTTT